MAKYYSGIDTSVGVGAETLDGMLANGSDFGVLPSKDIDCANINASGIHTVGGFFYPNGGIKDSSNSTGTSGKVLSSTGSGLAWIDPSEGSTANAVNVGTNLDSTNSDQFVAFMGASSGNNPVRVDADLKYNPNTNTLSVKGITLPGDDQKISIGADNPLEIQHSATSSQVELKSDAIISIMSGSAIEMENESGGNIARFVKSSGCELYHNVSNTSTLRLETTNDGVTITGDLTVTDIIANGNIDLGSDANDTLTISAKVDSDIVPSGTTRDLGGNSNRWRNLYAKTIRDKDNQTGTSGQVLSSTGTELDWINVGDLAAGSASQVAVSDESADTTCFPLFVTGATGNQSPKSGSNLTFNSADGTLSATTFSGSGASLTNIPSGQLSGALPAIDGSNLTGISDTTYDLLAVQTGGNNNDPAIKLDASSGDDDEIQIVGGTNVTVTRNSDSQITISSTDTNTNTQLSNEQVQDIVGGMVSGNTESGITVTYQDSDGTLDFSVGTLNQNTTGNAATATALASARTIAGSSFNGSANIDIDYDNLTNKPTIPTNNNQLTNGAGYVTAANAFPSGGIIIWSGAVNNIPTGWVLCDGNNSTPDLRDRFIVGAGTGGSYSPGNTGGSKDATLVSHSHTINNHTHSFSGTGSNTHSHGIPKGRGGSQASISNYIPTPRVEQIESPISTNNATISISISGTTGNPSDTGTNAQGSSATNANLPPYYALCYIMKT